MKKIKFLKGNNLKNMPGGKEMKLKRIALISLIAILMATAVYGAMSCTFDQTATTAGTASTYIKGTTQNLSASTTGWIDSGDNVTACTLTVNTGTITGALNFNSTTGTNNTYCNTTVNTIQLGDETTYTFTMTLKNSTEDTVGSCTRAFIPDNTVPVISLTTPSSGSKDTDGVITFTYTCTNSSSTNFYFDDNGKYTTYTMTESSNTCTYSGRWYTNGFHSHYAKGSDGLNTTTSSTSTIEIRKPGSSGTAEGMTITETGSETTGGKIGGGIGIIVILVILGIVFSDKKKKKK